MSKDPAFLFYSKDFIVGVQTLNWEDRGKYITILAQMHQQGRMDEETICFLVGSVSNKLRAKFKQDEAGLWYNERLELEAAKRSKYAQSRADNGKLGGRPAGKKATENHMVNDSLSKTKPTRKRTVDVNANVDASKKVKKELVFPFTSANFLHTWSAWLQYRKDIKKPYRSVLSEQAALKQLGLFDEEVAIKMIEKSIASGWQGIFELNEKAHGLIGKNTAEAIASIGTPAGMLERHNTYRDKER